MLRYNIYRMLTIIRATRCTNRGPWRMGVQGPRSLSRRWYRYRYRYVDGRRVVGKLRMCKNAIVAGELQNTFGLDVIIGFALLTRSESTVLEYADDIERKAASRLYVAQQPIFCSSTGFHCGMSTMVRPGRYTTSPPLTELSNSLVGERGHSAR